MTDPNPTFYKTSAFYKTATDINSLDGYGINDEALTYITHEICADPLAEGDGSERHYWGQNSAVRATPEELAQWTAAYNQFTADKYKIEAQLEAARAAWEAAQGIASAQMQDAWDAYQPTHAALESREAEVGEMRDAAAAAARERRQSEARAAQEAEDRELGPRTWVIHTPDPYARRGSAESKRTVIHLAGCPLTRGQEFARHSEYSFARAADAQAALLAEGPMMTVGERKGERLLTKLCGKCKPHVALEAALGDTYREWLKQAESVQQPMPRDRTTWPKALGLADRWNGRNLGNDRAGYTEVAAKYEREEKIIAPHETLIGWLLPPTDENGKWVVSGSNEAELDALIQELPARGYAARRHPLPKAFREKPEGKLSTSSVAVRRMTAHEIRQYKETGTLPGTGETRP